MGEEKLCPLLITMVTFNIAQPELVRFPTSLAMDGSKKNTSNKEIFKSNKAKDGDRFLIF